MKKQYINISIVIMILFSFHYLTIGLEEFSLNDLTIITKNSLATINSAIITYIKLPRLLMALLAGGALAVAGFVMQSALKNPLVSPQLFGTNSGASLAIVLTVMFFPKVEVDKLVFVAIIGASLGAILIYFIGLHREKSVVNLVLAGIAGNFFLKALTQALILLDKKERSDIVFWLSGSLSEVNWENFRVVASPIIITLIIIAIYSKKIAILEFDDDLVTSLGENLAFIRVSCLALVVVLCANVVAVTGPISFVGLIIPNIIKRIDNSSIMKSIMLSFLFGAILLLISEVLSKYISYPFETPVGIITAILGAPYFIYLALKEKNI